MPYSKNILSTNDTHETRLSDWLQSFGVFLYNEIYVFPLTYFYEQYEEESIFYIINIQQRTTKLQYSFNGFHFTTSPFLFFFFFFFLLLLRKLMSESSKEYKNAFDVNHYIFPTPPLYPHPTDMNVLVVEVFYFAAN